MALITTSDFNAIMDNVCLWTARARGDVGGSTGIGSSDADDRAFAALNDARDALLACADLEVVEALARAMLDAQSAGSWQTAFLQTWGSFIQRMNAHIARQQVAFESPGIEGYLTYYNAGVGGSKTALMPEIWRDSYAAWTGGQYPAAHNVYAERLVSASFPDGLGRKAVGGAFSAGASILGTSFCGGAGWAAYTSVTGGAHTITVTGNAYDHATRAVVSGVTWTALIPNGSGSVALIPGTAPANASILSVSGITGAAAGSGSIAIEARRPSGRLEIPAI